MVDWTRGKLRRALLGLLKSLMLRSPKRVELLDFEFFLVRGEIESNNFLKTKNCFILVIHIISR